MISNSSKPNSLPLPSMFKPPPSVSGLRADADVEVLGLRWRPLYRAKLSLLEAADFLGSYGATMFSIICSP